MPYILPQPIKQEGANHLVFPKFLSDSQCDDVIAMHKDVKADGGLVGANGEVDKGFRSSTLYWLDWTQKTHWIYEHLAVPLAKSNSQQWGFHISGLIEPLQLTHYKSSENGKYSWHQDYASSGMQRNRKLSATILLNDGFTGGNLEFAGLKDQPQMKKGDMIVFPSFVMHRVTDVT